MQMGLQEWIHKMEEGEGVRVLKGVLLLLAFAGLAAFYNVREFKNFASPEAMDSAQVGRNIAEGRGFTTRFVRPLSIALLQIKQGGPTNVMRAEHPDLAHAPVWPLLTAGLLKTLPVRHEIKDGATFMRHQPEVLLAIFSQVLFLALLAALFRLARTLFDGPVAWTTVIALALTELFWRFTVAGLPTLWLALLTVGIAHCLVAMERQAREQTGTARSFFLLAAAAGALIALGGLTRYSYGLLILPVAGFAVLFFGARRGAAVGVMAAVYLLALSPWVWRNYEISGRLFGTAGFAIQQGTVPFSGNRFERSMPKNLQIELNKVSPDQYLRKLVLGARGIVAEDLPKLGGSWITALFLAGLLVPFRNEGLNRLRYFVLAALLWFVVVQSLGRTAVSAVSPVVNSENLLVLFAPLVFMFGTGMFFMLIDQIEFAFPQYRTAAVAGFVAVAALPLLLAFSPPRSFPLAYPPYHPPSIQEVAGWMQPEELMMSDVPWAVAWYGGKKCVWTTLDTGNVEPRDFFAINDYQVPVKGLYLTPVTMDAKFLTEVLKGPEGAWSRFVLDSMMRTNVPTGFPLKHAPKGFLPDFLFLSDRARWPRD